MRGAKKRSRSAKTHLARRAQDSAKPPRPQPKRSVSAKKRPFFIRHGYEDELRNSAAWPAQQEYLANPSIELATLDLYCQNTLGQHAKSLLEGTRVVKQDKRDAELYMREVAAFQRL